eukprot:CAMPEP_0185184940 /NCGR_PEP_ID=MMETSP1140-20130426/2865_1 /TAXON_ID=298111 /ORGANISM="Pavlova sp., Strain CCMP459" /LENGTH=52 /DNA_ID=CAMNT_0027751033 /DNA_START=256 /DNA_END=415 /DNA_ORIENTATION=+
MTQVRALQPLRRRAASEPELEEDPEPPALVVASATRRAARPAAGLHQAAGVG